MGHSQPKLEDSWAWKGGISSQTYQRIAYERYNKPRVCELCGESHRISVHHRDRDRTNISKENLQILCDACHKRLHIRDGDMFKTKGVKMPKYSIDTILDLHNRGHSSNKIAEILGCTPQAIRYRLKRQGIKLTANNRDDILDSELESLYADGKTPREIAEIYGTSHTLVMRRLKTRGIKMRTKKESWRNQHASANKDRQRYTVQS